MTRTNDFTIYDVRAGSVLYADECFYVITDYVSVSNHESKSTTRSWSVDCYDEHDHSYIKSGVIEEYAVTTRSLVVFKSDPDEAKFRLLLTHE